MNTFCMMCGKPLVPGTPYCGECGAKVAVSSPTAAPTQSAALLNGPVRKPLSWWKALLIIIGIALPFCFIGGTEELDRLSKALALVVIATTTGWAHRDAKRLNLTHYKTHFPVNSVAAFVFFLWVIAFPWYLVVRSKIRVGVVPKAEIVSPLPKRGSVVVWTLVACGAVTLVVLGSQLLMSR